MECLCHVPVLEVEDVKWRIVILVKPVYQTVGEVGTVLDDIVSMWSEDMVLHPVHHKVQVTSREKMDLMLLGQGLGKVGSSI